MYMIRNGIKLSVAKRKISKLVEEREWKNFKVPVRSIGIIADIKNIKAFEVLEQLKDQFNIKSKNFKTLLYAENHQSVKDYSGQLYSLRDIDMKASIKNEELEKFTSERVDLLITFAEENNTAVHLITAFCAAGIKVGRYRKNEALYDIILQADNDLELFTEELLKYIKYFKKSKNE
ncbi:hypothetical protein GILI108418_05600 [Gillisia limnaea]|uniref:Uncharacterized protein n=1 Tax=Gillisia limnaea (strain DSM 15749 / LMG 21470 / R-8282) TaxID=865937 RepID=H2BST8_GILLR|nr:hypothetical protein Gilli_3064 [Gillisia limnaea DSM 15749]